MIERFPLTWPDATPRSPRPTRAAFKVSSLATARDALLHEVKLLGGRSPIISSNVPIRSDGLMYGDSSAPEPRDRGVAIYFELRGRPHALACDRWDRVRDNLHALELTIGALRGLERWGSSDLVERAFRGFAALPAAPGWRDVLDLGPGPVAMATVEAQFRILAAKAHPDVGGDHERMVALNRAREEAERELGSLR